RGCRVVDGELEPRRGYRASPACHRETTQSCGGQRFHNVTNRVHLTCTPGSVGAPGSNPWSDPAQEPSSAVGQPRLVNRSRYANQSASRSYFSSFSSLSTTVKTIALLSGAFRTALISTCFLERLAG